VSLVVSVSSAILEHGTEISSKQLVTLRWVSVRINLIKYVTLAGKQACFPEPVCSNTCCGRFQVSFPNQSSNFILCNNYVWLVFHPFSSPVSSMPSEAARRKRPEVADNECYVGKLNNVHPIFPNTVHHLDIPRMRIVTIQRLENGTFFRQLHRTDKMFETLRKALFLDPSNLVTSLYWTWWKAIQEFSLHVAPRKHQKIRNICNGGIHAVNNCHEWNPLR